MTDLPPGRFVWEKALRVAEIPPTTHHVLLALGTYVDNDTGIARPSQATVARDAKLKESTVRKHVRLAQELGWLERVARGHHVPGHPPRANVYRTAIPEGFAVAVEPGQPLRDGSQPLRGEQSTATGVAPITPRTTTNDSEWLEGGGEQASAEPPCGGSPPPDAEAVGWIDELLARCGYSDADPSNQRLLAEARRLSRAWTTGGVERRLRPLRRKGIVDQAAYLAKLLSGLPNAEIDDPELRRRREVDERRSGASERRAARAESPAATEPAPGSLTAGSLTAQEMTNLAQRLAIAVRRHGDPQAYGGLWDGEAHLPDDEDACTLACLEWARGSATDGDVLEALREAFDRTWLFPPWLLPVPPSDEPGPLIAGPTIPYDLDGPRLSDRKDRTEGAGGGHAVADGRADR